MRHQVARQSDLDPRVPDFLDALSQGRITIALARKGETQALVWPAAADAPLAQRLRHHLHVPGQQQLQALQQTLPELMELMELMVMMGILRTFPMDIGIIMIPLLAGYKVDQHKVKQAQQDRH